MAETAERSVYFFRLEVLPHEDGSIPDFSIASALASINALAFNRNSTGPDSRYADADNAVIAAWPVVTRTRRRLRLGKIRRTDLPGVEEGGNISALDLAKTAGVVDTTHIQFFDDNIVGAEYNHYGPRASGFSSYCEDKIGDLPHFRLRPLLHKNAADQLDSLEDVRLVSIRVRPSSTELLARMEKSIPDALSAVADEYGADAIDIVLRAPRRQPLRGKILSALKGILKASDNPMEDFKSFHVRGKSSETEQIEWFDLLKDRFIVDKTVAKMPDRTRRIESESMFSAIEAAYNSLRNELVAAPALGIEI